MLPRVFPLQGWGHLRDHRHDGFERLCLHAIKGRYTCFCFDRAVDGILVVPAL